MSNSLNFNGRPVMAGGRPVVAPPPVYTVYCSGTHGTVTATPSFGPAGTVVTLTNTPDSGYEFDSYSVTGATLSGNTFIIGNSDVTVVGNFVEEYDPWNPLNLPAYTIRVQLTDASYDCSNKGFPGTWVSRGNGVWDITYENTNWSRLLTDTIGYWSGMWNRKEHRILGMNSTGVTNMERIEDCGHDWLIGTLPLFDTRTLTNVENAFYECYYVDGGQLALCQQMINQANPPANHVECFQGCGLESPTGSVELAQIPSDWK